MVGMATTIQVSEAMADELHDRKKRGDSYQDVLERLLSVADADLVNEAELNEQGRLYLGAEAGGRRIRYTIQYLD